MNGDLSLRGDRSVSSHAVRGLRSARQPLLQHPSARMRADLPRVPGVLSATLGKFKLEVPPSATLGEFKLERAAERYV